MNSEIINAKIEKRILVTDAPIFSGETVKVRLAIDAADAVASNHKLVLFGDDKKALAEGTFTATESAWIADLNTATNEMAAYFADVPVDATKSIGAMVVNTLQSDVITRGNVLVVSTPFPDDLSPCPQTYSYLTTEEFSSTVADLETEIGGKADESDFIQMSSDVADLTSEVLGMSSTVANLAAVVPNKAESSDVANLEQSVISIHEDLFALSSTVADKADVSALAEMSSSLEAEIDFEAQRADNANAEMSSSFDDALDGVMQRLGGYIDDLSSSVSDLATQESSDVAALTQEVINLGEQLANEVYALEQSLSAKADAADLDDKADSSDVAEVESSLAALAADVADKAESSTVANLAASLPYARRTVTATSSAIAVNTREVLGIEVESSTSLSSLSLSLPAETVGKSADFIVDVANNQATDVSVNFGGIWAFAVDKGANLADIKTIASGDLARIYFTQIGIESGGDPVLHVSRKDLEIVSNS